MLYAAKPGGLFAEACAGAELSACRKRGGFRMPLGSLGDFDRMEAFLLVRRRDYTSPQEPILFPRSLYGSSVIRCSMGFCVKAHWGLNKMAGILVVPSAHPREAKGFHPHFITTKNHERRNSFRRANCVSSDTRLRRVSGLWSP